jgi:putative ABC transport system permease protein
MVSLPATSYPPDQVVAWHDRLDEALRAIPGVTSVGRISELPLGTAEQVNSFTRPDLPPPAPGRGPSARIATVDPEYFSTMGIAVLAGRAFDMGDRQGSQPVVVISRRMADTFWRGENPIGRPIQISRRDPAVVIGVVSDVRSTAVGMPPQPEMFVPHGQTQARTMNYILQSPLDTTQLVSAARQIVRKTDARLPLISPGSMEELFNRHLGRPQFYVVLLGLFAALALALAAVGIYGVVAYVVSQRTREIGVRMALGARRTQIVGLMLWQGLRPAIVGVAVGLLAAFAAGRVIQGLLYEVQPHDPLTFAGVTAALLLVVIVACAVPARKATSVPPAEALRTE